MSYPASSHGWSAHGHKKNHAKEDIRNGVQWELTILSSVVFAIAFLRFLRLINYVLLYQVVLKSQQVFLKKFYGWQNAVIW